MADQKTAVNADILRLMGVVTGTGGNQFNPHGTLTRAQFCTMVMTFLQKGDEAPRYATRTIFTDVTSTHWARSFVNMAASYTVTEGEGAAVFWSATSEKDPGAAEAGSTNRDMARAAVRMAAVRPSATWAP